MSKKSILILCGGGQPPSINSFISTVTNAFLKDEYKVLGFHEGFEIIFAENPKTINNNLPLTAGNPTFGFHST
tara:strand:+ start:72 stop:290 length:219 start_codon:yes stop_codon:yes gene_type:complete